MGEYLKTPLRVPYLVVQVANTQTQAPNQGQTQVRKLIRKAVKGKILEIHDMGNGEYLVWTKYIIDGDDDAEIWDIYYRIKIQGNNVEVLDEDWE